MWGFSKDNCKLRQTERDTSNAERRIVKSAASLPVSPSIQAVRSRPSMIHSGMVILLFLALAFNSYSPKISYHHLV